MSKFLGPIHYWLHKKIQIHDSLEIKWEEQMKKLNGHTAEVEATLNHLNQKFGPPLLNESLEESIDSTNIHGWLAQRIGNSETRFAAKLTTLTNRLGPNPFDEALKIYSDFGRMCGLSSIESYDHTLPSAFKLLNNYILEGMPCDHASAVTEQSENHFSWKSTRCLHQAYWTQIGGDINHYLQLRDAFNTSFFNALNNLPYTRVQNGNETHYTIGGHSYESN